jgi:phage shock protein B
MGELVVILSLSVIAPLVIIGHFVTKWRDSKGLSKEDEKMLEDLWSSSQRMESRINSLETILDDVAPDWRKRT